MLPSRRIAQELNVEDAYIEHLERTPPKNRNKTWRCELENREQAVYLKVQGGERHSRSVGDEANVLAVLSAASFPYVPKLLARGCDDTNGPYFVCEERPGCPLHTYLEEGDISEFEPFFGDVIDWLQHLQTLDCLRCVLEERSHVGVYRKDFNPTTKARDLCTDLSATLDHGSLRRIRDWIEACPEVRTSAPFSIIHGSLSTHNLLVATTSRPTLTGVLDFEAMRLGDLAFDVATLALYFLMCRCPSAARKWLSMCTNQLDTSQILERAVSFIIYLYLMRQKNGAESVPPPDEFSDFLLDLDERSHSDNRVA